MARLLTTIIQLALLSLTSTALAQDDLRDRITLVNGRVLQGRVATPYALDELLVLTGGKRTRVDRAKVQRADTVASDVAAFFKRRHQYQRSPRALQYLVDWAAKEELPGLARLQAMELVLQNDRDAEMHGFLGNRQRKQKWQWRRDGKWRTREQLEASLTERPIRLTGERFAITCDAALLTNVRALLDLEYLAVAWFEEFGRDLELREVLEPIEVRTFRNAEVFPKWGYRPRPYFEPPPHSDIGRTFYSGPAPTRPDALFFVGVQGLLYRSMIGEVDPRDSRDRVCAWLEVGLGMHLQQRMQGPAGFAQFMKSQQPDLIALRALGRGYRLTHLIHLPMYASFYLTDDTVTATNWAAAEMFATWLLDKNNPKQLRGPFLSYIRAALRERQGDSSTTFDRLIGTPIEQLEEPWLAWLNDVAGN